MKKSSDIRFVQALKHRSAIMAVIMAVVRDFDVAEDLFQDTMLEIVRHWNRFDADRDFLQWAKGIARNMVRRYFRTLSQPSARVDYSALEIITDVIMEDEPNEIWERERMGLQQCLQRLPEKNRRLVFLRYGENIKGEALARISNMKLTSLRTTLARIRRRLRNCINAYIGNLATTEEGNYG